MGLKATGFASPAQGYEETTIDLNSLLIRNPSASYFYRLDSSDMRGLGLPKGALLLVDRSKKPQFKQFVVIQHEGQFLVRLLVEDKGAAVFSNGKTDIVPIAGETLIIGVVTAFIQELDYDFSC